MVRNKGIVGFLELLKYSSILVIGVGLLTDIENVPSNNSCTKIPYYIFIVIKSRKMTLIRFKISS